MGQARAGCQEGEAGGYVCVAGRWGGGAVTGQVRLEKLETRPVMVTTAPGTRRLPCVPSHRPGPLLRASEMPGIPISGVSAGACSPRGQRGSRGFGGGVSPGVWAGGTGGLQ